MTQEIILKKVSELKLGDVLQVWFNSHATIVNLKPHPKYKEMFSIDGALIAEFAGGDSMTLEPHMLYKVYTVRKEG